MADTPARGRQTMDPPDPDAPDTGGGGLDGQSDGAPPRSSTRTRLATAGVVLVVVVSVGLWAYALLTPQEVPGQMADRSFAEEAERVCAGVAPLLAGLPHAVEAADAVERAAFVDQGTVILDALVDDLEALVPASGPERAMVQEWLADWRTYLADRRDYADRLRADDGARFYITQSDRDGRQINLAMDRFAQVNNMGSCVIPDDVG